MMDIAAVRSQFPALHRRRGGHAPVFFDGPAGTQVPQRTIDAIVHYLSNCSANQGGYFATSEESDRLLHQAHCGMAALLNAPSPEEIIFGPNMTTLTLQLSRAIGKTLTPGDEVIVTHLDHDANVTPWVLAAADAGAAVKQVDIHPEDCSLDMEDLKRHLSDRTKLVAVTCASNLVGTLVDVAEVCRLAHEAGALVFLDAVHYAAHRSIDVQAWDCDFLVCSPYKFYGPHLGVLWGQRALLEQLPAYKVRPASATLPSKWMTGTQNHEGIAGLTGTLHYLMSIGQSSADNEIELSDQDASRAQFVSSLAQISEYENELALRLLRGLSERSKFRVWGIADPDRLERRAPTFSITHAEKSPERIAHHLAQRQIYSWNGNSYALALTERLGLEDSGGMLRVGLVHYNTAAEVDRLLAALDEL